MIQVIISLFIGFILGLLIKIVKIQKKNQQIEQENNQLEKDFLEKKAKLTQEYSEIQDNINNTKSQWKDEQLEWATKKANLNAELTALNNQINEKQNSINYIVEKTMDAAVGHYESSIENEENRYLKAAETARNNYYDMLKEFEQMYSDFVAKKEEEMQIITNQLADAESKAKAAIECNKRAELERTKKDFYRIQLSNLDIQEIEKIRSIAPYLRQKEPLNKVIWKVYYEKPTTDLIGRVVGATPKTGIYKITNIDNGMCYVGQAINIAERFKQHIKRGIGADPPTQNKLYPAMQSLGVENFMFEIIEECPIAKLSEREKYWTTFYEAQTYGFSIRKG